MKEYKKHICLPPIRTVFDIKVVPDKFNKPDFIEWLNGHESYIDEHTEEVTIRGITVFKDGKTSESAMEDLYAIFERSVQK